jgi:Family of unknown function (DUF5990)
MFRRAKVFLDAIPANVLRSSIDGGVLVGRLGFDRSNGPSVVRGGPAAADRMVGDLVA